MLIGIITLPIVIVVVIIIIVLCKRCRKKEEKRRYEEGEEPPPKQQLEGDSFNTFPSDGIDDDKKCSENKSEMPE